MRELTGQNIIVLDLETLYAADDCRLCFETKALHLHLSEGLMCCGSTGYASGTYYDPIGWQDKGALGLSIGCYYDYSDGELHWFDRLSLADTMRMVAERQPLLVSFNGKHFDFPLICALLRHDGTLNALEERLFPLFYTLSYDIFAEIQKSDPVRAYEKGLNGLDAISQANGYGRKELSATLAPVAWREGQYAKVIAYNVGDVRKTRMLFWQIVATGTLMRGDGSTVVLPMPTLPGEMGTGARDLRGGSNGC